MEPKFSRKKSEVCVLVFKYDHGKETVSTTPPQSKGRKANGKSTIHPGRKG